MIATLVRTDKNTEGYSKIKFPFYMHYGRYLKPCVLKTPGKKLQFIVSVRNPYWLLWVEDLGEIYIDISTIPHIPDIDLDSFYKADKKMDIVLKPYYHICIS